MSNDFYNYEHFHVRYYELLDFKHPKPGEIAPDFTAYDSSGKEVKLSDYRGQRVILETGSITCPMYAKNIIDMNALEKKYPEFTFLLLYVREAHPGGKIGAHQSMDEKIQLASLLITEEREYRRVLVDDLEGSAHQIYGALPNMIYVIETDGRIAAMTAWNEPDKLEEALNKLRAGEAVGEYYAFGTPPMDVSLRVFARAGFVSLWDFIIHLPALMVSHAKRAYTEWRNPTQPQKTAKSV